MCTEPVTWCVKLTMSVSYWKRVDFDCGSAPLQADWPDGTLAEFALAPA